MIYIEFYFCLTKNVHWNMQWNVPVNGSVVSEKRSKIKFNKVQLVECPLNFPLCWQISIRNALHKPFPNNNQYTKKKIRRVTEWKLMAPTARPNSQISRGALRDRSCDGCWRKKPLPCETTRFAHAQQRRNLNRATQKIRKPFSRRKTCVRLKGVAHCWPSALKTFPFKTLHYDSHNRLLNCKDKRKLGYYSAQTTFPITFNVIVFTLDEKDYKKSHGQGIKPRTIAVQGRQDFSFRHMLSSLQKLHIIFQQSPTHFPVRYKVCRYKIQPMRIRA